MKIQTYRTKQPDTTYLQGIGFTLGTEAGRLKAGDTMIWNNGYKSTVMSIISETEKTITINELWSDGVTFSPRTMKKSRIVGRPVHELVAVGKQVFQLKPGDFVMCNRTVRKVLSIEAIQDQPNVMNIVTAKGTFQALAGSIVTI